MASLRRFLATSNHPLVRAAKATYQGIGEVSLPTPGWMTKPALWGYVAGRSVIHFGRRVLIAEPLFKAYVRSHGTGVVLIELQGSAGHVLKRRIAVVPNGITDPGALAGTRHPRATPRRGRWKDRRARAADG